MNAETIMQELSKPGAYTGLSQYMYDARKEAPEISAALRSGQPPTIVFPGADKPVAIKDIAFMDSPAAESGFAPFRPFEKSAAEALPPFPVDTFPLAPFVYSTAKSLQVDPSMVAVPTLAAVAIAARRNFFVNPDADWMEPLNLYATTAAEASERKTAVMGAVIKPLAEYENEWNIEHAAVVDEYRDRLEVTEAEIIATKKKIAAGKASLEDLSELTARRRQLQENPERFLRLTAADATPEALERLLMNNGGVIALVNDEGGILTTVTGGRYSDVRSLDTILKGYSVNGPAIQIDRKGSPDAIRIEKPCVTLNIMCQPVTVRKLVSDDEFNQRGLTARFLYAFPPSCLPNRLARSNATPRQAVEGYAKIMRCLLALRDNGGEPRVIRFSEEAANGRDAWFYEIRDRMMELDPEDPFRAWLGKLDGQTARIVGLLHLLLYMDKADTTPIEAETYQGGVMIARYFLANAEYAFSMSGASESQAEKDARYIWKRIRESGQAKVAKRDLIRLCRRFKGAEEMESGLKELTERGYIRVEERRTAGRPAVTVYTNPEALKEN